MAGGADSEVKVKFTTEHDGRGAEEANKTLEKTKQKADGAAGGFSRFGKAVSGFKSVMEKANSALAGFGVMALVGQIMRLVQAFKDAQEAHEDMVAAIGADNAAAAVKRLKKAYDELKESITRVSQETATVRENTDLLIDAERRLEDAALSRREEDEVAALDKDDPLRKEKEAEIRARYGQQRAETAGRRADDDMAIAEANLRADINRLHANIAERDDKIADLEEAAREYSGKAAAAQDRSLAESKKFSIFGRGRNWLGGQRKGIEQYAGYANEYNKQAGSALAGVMQGERDNDADRRAIAAAEERLKAMAAQRKAARAESDNAKTAADRTAATATADLASAARQRERDRADLERARREKADLDARKKQLEANKAAAAWRAQETERQARQARAALDSHASSAPSGGNKGRWRGALDSLKKNRDDTQAEAAEAARALETLGEATAKTLETINAKASAAAARIKALESRLGRDPHGDGEAG